MNINNGVERKNNKTTIQNIANQSVVKQNRGKQSKENNGMGKPRNKRNKN